MNFIKKNLITYLLCISGCLNFTNYFSQDTDSLKLKLEKFDSFDFHEKRELVNEYIESDFNYNEANLFILTFFEFLQPIDFQIFKNTFDKTSFSSNELKSDSLYFLLNIQLEESNIDHALEIYQTIEDQNSKWFKPSSELLSSFYYDLDIEKSLKFYEQYFKFDALKHINSKGESANYWRDVNDYFQLLFINQKFDTIIIYSDSILMHKPNDEIWLKRKSEAQYYAKKYESASKTYCELYELNNEFKYVQSLLRVYKKLDDTLSTLSLITENIDLRGEKDIEIRFLYFDYLFHFELHDLKDLLIKEVLKNTPDFYSTTVPSEAFYYYSFFQFYNNQTDEAISTLHQAIALVDPINEKSPYKSLIDPPSFHDVYDYYVYDGNGNMFISKYYNLIGWIFDQQGKTKKAIKNYKVAIDYFDCNPNSNYLLAYTYRESFWRSNKKAIIHFKKVVSCDVFGWSNYSAISELGRHYYYKEKEYAKTKEILLSEIEFSDLKSNDYYILSQIYRKEENYFESLKMIDKAIELEEDKFINDFYIQIREKIETLSKTP